MTKSENKESKIEVKKYEEMTREERFLTWLSLFNATDLTPFIEIGGIFKEAAEEIIRLNNDEEFLKKVERYEEEMKKHNYSAGWVQYKVKTENGEVKDVEVVDSGIDYF